MLMLMIPTLSTEQCIILILTYPFCPDGRQQIGLVDGNIDVSLKHQKKYSAYILHLLWLAYVKIFFLTHCLT